jgi:hypothetical protein
LNSSVYFRAPTCGERRPNEGFPSELPRDSPAREAKKTRPNQRNLIALLAVSTNPHGHHWCPLTQRAPAFCTVVPLRIPNGAAVQNAVFIHLHFPRIQLTGRILRCIHYSIFVKPTKQPEPAALSAALDLMLGDTRIAPPMAQTPQKPHRTHPSPNPLYSRTSVLLLSPPRSAVCSYASASGARRFRHRRTLAPARALPESAAHTE